MHYPKTVDVLNVITSLKCNLGCESCNSYSNLRIKGTDLLENNLIEDVKYWKQYVNPTRLQILGGEPLLIKNLDKIIKHCREAFPNTDLRLFTNGLLLKKHKYLLKTLKDTNCILVISVHSVEKRYKDLLTSAILDFLDNENISNTEKSIVSFAKVYETMGVKVELRNMVKNWNRLYTKDFKPYNSDPIEAHEACRWDHCTQLYKGKLFKCPQAAFLSDFIETLDDPTEWLTFKENYVELSKEATEKERNIWFDTYRKPEDICRMCPSSPENIKNKNIWKNSKTKEVL